LAEIRWKAKELLENLELHQEKRKKMTTYTTLVNVDAESALKLASFIASKLPSPQESEQFSKECTELIEKMASHELVKKILQHNDIILSLESDDG
jgi:hypothetical protein